MVSVSTQKHGSAKEAQLRILFAALSPHLPEASADAAKEAARQRRGELLRLRARNATAIVASGHARRTRRAAR